MHSDTRHPNLARGSILSVNRHRLHRIQRPPIFSAIDDLADDSILSIQMRLLGVRDEELRLVCVWSCIGTCNDTATVKLERGSNFVSERFAPDRLTAFACPCRIACLDHEGFDVAVPFDVVVCASCTVAEKVFGCAGCCVAEHFDLYVSKKMEADSSVECREVVRNKDEAVRNTDLDITKGGVQRDRHDYAT